MSNRKFSTKFTDSDALEKWEEESHEQERCAITGNLCGTDTWADGCPCLCENCKKYLIKNQEPLGEEFTKVLSDNYWDLLAK